MQGIPDTLMQNTLLYFKNMLENCNGSKSVQWKIAREVKHKRRVQ